MSYVLRLRRSLFAASAAFLAALHIAAIGPYWEITPDSSVYIEGARSIVGFESYDIPLRPPAASLTFALPMALESETYWASNALTTVFTLAAMIPAYLFVRTLRDSAAASAVVLLSLASTLMFRYGTLMLSESLFLLASMTAVYCTEAGRRGEWRGRSLIAAAGAIFIATMTRIVGFTLAVAAALDELISAWRSGRGRQGIRRKLVGVMALIVVAGAAWEWRNVAYGYSTIDLALQARPWAPAEGSLTLSGLAERVAGNLIDFKMIGHILANGDPSHAETHPLFRLASAATFSLFALGFALRLRSPGPLEFYLLICFGLFSAYYVEVAIRWFAPLVPVLWFYAWEGACFLDALWAARPSYQAIARTAAAAALGAYCLFGVRYMLDQAGEAHQSPFAHSWIKYPENYDLQRAAMEAGRRSAPGEVILTQHAEIVREIAGRPAVSFPFTRTEQAWSDLFRSTPIAYVAADELQPMVRDYLLPVLDAQPERFVLTRDFGDARLYSVTRPSDKAVDRR